MVDINGVIIDSSILRGDGKNQMGDQYFVTANFISNDEIIVQNFWNVFRYTIDFELIEKKESPYTLITRNVGGGRSSYIFDNYLYTFSVDKSDEKSYHQSEKDNLYPFMQIRNYPFLEIVAEASFPPTSEMVKSPGEYLNMEPVLKMKDSKLFALYPNSKELYTYSFPDLELIDTLDLNPGKNFKQVKPTLEDDPPLAGFFKNLAGSDFLNFHFSNEYLMTWYEGAAPQNEVDGLPRESVGGEEFMNIVKKYKKPFYQIFKNEKKLWEGELEVKLFSIKDKLFSFSKPGEDPNAIEKDIQTLYFYELR
ncbi:hypothetical protein [Algoriphagus sp.]|uniref:hypothetical protein n=1 Tax=Algoriphagus sp. TaxID=1872435 RepID=UPI0027242754|nr:hypothetical protein [Algoriphagus sp.]MDO8966199.1 hypothetical protein [Algoriphagus sp.]MDP3198637.1 hypothetical protein [Algoriphagus sp.]